MNKREADSLLHSVDHNTLEAAKSLMKQLLPAMKGGKWDTLTMNQKICILTAIAIKYGERRGANGETEPAGKETTV